MTEDMNKDPYKSLKKLASDQSSNQFPDELIINNYSITNKLDVMKELSKSFFPDPKPINKKQQVYIDEYQTYLSQSQGEELPQITKFELENAIFSLKKKSAPGKDGISIELIQLAYILLETILLRLFNACLNISHYPTKWKVAKITVLKKPNKETYKTPKSFRAISVLDTLGKILEKILYERLNWLSKENSWFKGNQHGFREGKGTESAMHSLSQVIENNFSKKEYTTVLFLDISGAFDCAWPSAILAALAKRKCPTYLLRFIKSLFENRTARLSHGQYTFLYHVLIECPQGGILSPFLWTILAEEIIKSYFNFSFKIISYADDIALVTMHKVLEIAIKPTANERHSFSKLSRYFTRNKSSKVKIYDILKNFSGRKLFY